MISFSNHGNIFSFLTNWYYNKTTRVGVLSVCDLPPNKVILAYSMLEEGCFVFISDILIVLFHFKFNYMSRVMKEKVF